MEGLVVWVKESGTRVKHESLLLAQQCHNNLLLIVCDNIL